MFSSVGVKAEGSAPQGDPGAKDAQVGSSCSNSKHVCSWEMDGWSTRGLASLADARCRSSHAGQLNSGTQLTVLL